MAKSIFEKIADREIPAYIVWEDQKHIAFLDINPLVKGHTLVVPKVNVGDELLEVSDELYHEILTAAKKVGQMLKRKFKCDRVVMMVEGFAVPHIHVHLLPVFEGFHIDGAKVMKVNMEELEKVHKEIIN